MRGFKSGDETYEFEARIEFSTAKAHLVEPTVGEQCWVPKSQVISMTDVGDGLFIFVVKAWWAGKQGWL